jgi:lipopolysaccharide cholinephosphotransferase
MTKDPNKLRTKEEFVVQGNLLADVAKVLVKYSIPATLSDGIVLGIVRENDFIPWDFDGDFFVEAERVMGLEEKIARDLKMLGFDIITVRGALNDWKVAVDKYDYHIDIRSFMRIKDWHVSKVRRSNGKWSMYTMPTKFMDNLQKVEFYGYNYNIPVDVEGYLTHLYGDWQTPKQTCRHSEYLNPEFKTEKWI